MKLVDTPTITSVIFCDDARKEVGGKDLLVGVYGGRCLIPAFPGSLRLAVWFRYHPVASGSQSFTVRVANASSDHFAVNFEVDVTDVEPLNMFTPILLVPVAAESDLVLEAAFRGDVFAECGRLHVQAGPVPQGTSSRPS